MASTITAGTTSGTALAMSGDTSGNLNLLSGTTTVLALTATGVAVTGTLSASGVTTNAAGSAALPSITTTGDTDTGVWFPAANTLAASTAGTERMRIDSSGGISVGTSDNSPTSGAGFKYTQNGTNPYLAMVVSSTSGQNNYHLYSTGASAFRFYVSSAGQINATSTSITAISDESLKENICDLETGLTEVMALRPRRFDWKEETKLPEKNNAGFIAQEVEQVLPELVYDYQYDTDTTKKALKMGDILPTLVKAIQEQQALIIQLQADVAALKGVKA